MELLETESVFSEADCEVVKQFGVRWPIALVAKIFGSFDDAGAKVLLPNAVDENPVRQRILFINEPLGKTQPIDLGEFGFKYSGQCSAD